MLTRLEQIAIAQEALEDSAVSDANLYVAGNMAYSVIDPESTFDLQTYERRIKRDTLTPLRGLTGMKMGMFKFSLEMAGTLLTDGSQVPEFDLPLRACGFRKEKLVKLTIGAITGGPFKHGETVTQATSGAFGVVIGDTYTGQTELWVAQENRLGHAQGTSITAFTTTSGHTLTGGSSGATAAEPSAVAGTVSGTSITVPAGLAWYPASFALQRTFTRATSEGILAAIADREMLRQPATGAPTWLGEAQGAYSIQGVASLPVFLRRIFGHLSQSGTTADREVYNLSGTKVYTTGTTTNAEHQFAIPSLTIGGLYDGVRESIAGARGSVRLRCPIGEPAILEFEFKGKKNTFADGGLVTGVSYVQALPPVVLDADFSVGGDSTTFANEVTPCVAEVAFDMGVDVQYRKSIDEATGLKESYISGRKPTFTMDPELIPETFFDWMAKFTGNSNFRTRMRVGTALGNRFRILAPGMAVTSSGMGDRDGIRTRQIQGALTSGTQTASTLNKDNEFVIIWEAQ